jgi:rRNA metabolism protein, SBDS family
MVNVDDTVVARHVVKGKRFEILVDADKAREVKEGSKVPFDELLASEEVYNDAGKGERAGEKELKETFKSSDLNVIVYEIIKKGTIQLTTEQRKKAVEAKRKQIVSFITRSAINPQTKTPHPPQRIEKAMEEARVGVDPFKPVEGQVKDILNALRPIIPIRIENVNLEIVIPAQSYGRCYSVLKEYGKFKTQGWLNNGDFRCVIEMPAGLKVELMDTLHKRTGGKVEIKEVK